MCGSKYENECVWLKCSLSPSRLGRCVQVKWSALSLTVLLQWSERSSVQSYHTLPSAQTLSSLRVLLCRSWSVILGSSPSNFIQSDRPISLGSIQPKIKTWPSQCSDNSQNSGSTFTRINIKVLFIQKETISTKTYLKSRIICSHSSTCSFSLSFYPFSQQASVSCSLQNILCSAACD